jgi:hypothetical protein
MQYKNQNLFFCGRVNRFFNSASNAPQKSSLNRGSVRDWWSRIHRKRSHQSQGNPFTIRFLRNVSRNRRLRFGRRRWGNSRSRRDSGRGSRRQPEQGKVPLNMEICTNPDLRRNSRGTSGGVKFPHRGKMSCVHGRARIWLCLSWLKKNSRWG